MNKENVKPILHQKDAVFVVVMQGFYDAAGHSPYHEREKDAAIPEHAVHFIRMKKKKSLWAHYFILCVQQSPGSFQAVTQNSMCLI